MRVPIRKGGKYTNIKSDPLMTKPKLEELKNELKKLKKLQPELANEVKRLAAMGDFSENAAYQIAKGRLRGLNERIDKLEKQIASAQIIEKTYTTKNIQVGSIVIVEINGQQAKYQILGSVETDPKKGIISYTSPLGQVLLGKKVGQFARLNLEDKILEYKVIKIN